MTKLAAQILSYSLLIPLLSFSQNSYTYLTDLVNIIDDQVSIKLETPAIASPANVMATIKILVKDFTECNIVTSYLS